MYGTQLIEMAQVAEQEHMQKAVLERARAQQGAIASCAGRDGSLGRGPLSGLPGTMGKRRVPRRMRVSRRILCPAPTANRAIHVSVKSVCRQAAGVATRHRLGGRAQPQRKLEKRPATPSTSTLGHVPAGNRPRAVLPCSGSICARRLVRAEGRLDGVTRIAPRVLGLARVQQRIAGDLRVRRHCGAVRAGERAVDRVLVKPGGVSRALERREIRGDVGRADRVVGLDVAKDRDAVRHAERLRLGDRLLRINRSRGEP